jgi:hypothetical protein
MSFQDNIAKEAMRIEEDATYSSKGHYEAAKIWDNVYLWLGIPTAIIAGISGISAFQECSFLAGITAVIAAALAATSTFLNPSEKAQAHYTAGSRFNSLKNRARIFREIELQDSEMDYLKKRIIELSEERHTANSESPQIPRRAFESARKGIEQGESEYIVDSDRKEPNN